MKKPWMFTGNPFDSATRDSNRKMLSIGSRTNSKLADQLSDPEILTIYNEYNPVFVAYRNICNTYDIATGTREGKTLNLTELLAQMKKVEIPLWEGKVRSVYAEGTPEEKEFFPDKRKPFLQGNYEERIEAVDALATRLADSMNPILAAYAPTVESFYNTLNTARDLQVQKENRVELLSNDRENQRKLLAASLYTVVASLMVKYKNNPSAIDAYFDLSLIREKKETVAADEAIVKGKVTLSGTGAALDDVPVKLYEPGSDEPVKVYSNKRGYYKFKFDHLNPGIGIVTMKVDVPGFELFELTFEGAPGHIYVKNIVLNEAVGMLKKVA